MIRRIRVLCVDDNKMLADALCAHINDKPGLEWAGWLQNGVNVMHDIRSANPDVILMDIDMPGPDPFETILALAGAAPEIRAVMFSAHIRQDYIDRAAEAGAWGYVSKNESMTEVMDAIRRVHHGEFVLSSEALDQQRDALPRPRT